MKDIITKINEAKSYFPKLNKNILGLFDKLSKEDKTGKQLIKFLYDELYKDISSAKLKDLKALFNGYEDKSFYVVYGNGNYGDNKILEIYKLHYSKMMAIGGHIQIKQIIVRHLKMMKQVIS